MNAINAHAGRVGASMSSTADGRSLQAPRWRRKAATGVTVLATVGGSALAVFGWSPAAFAASPAAGGATPAASTPRPTPTLSSDCAKSDVVIVSRNADLTTVSVRLASGSSGVSCDVSLHAYQTDGPTWPTSGDQRLVGFATVHLTSDPQSLSVTGSSCYGQNDLVIGTTKNDGVDGPAPHYPVQVFASNTLATWIGGSACPTPSVSPTVTPTTSVSPTATATSTVTPGPTTPTTVLPLQLAAPSSPAPSVLGVQFAQSPPTAVLPAAQQLPFTGSPLALEALAAATLIGAGAVLFGIGRRRNAERAGSQD